MASIARVASSPRVGGLTQRISRGWQRFGLRASAPSLELLVEEHLADAEPVERLPELELRMAELREPVDSWPAGTRGTIVDAFEDEAILEITGEDGSALALLSLPYSALTLLPAREQTRLTL
jgi:hypothetical protein